jgi:hypothetical protein
MYFIFTNMLHPFLYIILFFSFSSSSKLPEGFVYLTDTEPLIQQDIRYAKNFNFMGRIPNIS